MDTHLFRYGMTTTSDMYNSLGIDLLNIFVFYLCRLFKAYPSVFAYFKSLHGMDFDTMKDNAKLKAHTINFKLGIRSFVENLDDPDTLVILIQKNTANHFRRGIRTPEFQVSTVCCSSTIYGRGQVRQIKYRAG